MTNMPPRSRRRIWPWILGLSLLLILALCGGSVALMANSTQPSSPVLPNPPNPSPNSKPVAKAKSSSIGEGTWLVGKEVEPGKYRTPGARDGIFKLCTWQTSTTEGDENIVDFGTVDSTDEPGRVTLKTNQYFKTSGCEGWVKQ